MHRKDGHLARFPLVVLVSSLLNEPMGVWLNFLHFWSSKKNVGGLSLALPLSDSLSLFLAKFKIGKGKGTEIKFTKKKFRAREKGRVLERQIVPWRILKKNQNYSFMFLEV